MWPCQARRVAEIINSGIQPLQNLATLKKLVDIFGVDSKKAEWAQHFITKGFQGTLLLLFQRPFIAFAITTLLSTNSI